MDEAPALVSAEQWEDGLLPVNNPALPYVGPIPGGVGPGKTIQVLGRIAKNANKFSINLQCGENSLPYADAAFHFSPRFEDIVVLNTHTEGHWGAEERNQTIPTPFVRGENFEVVIQCEVEKYKIYVNRKHYVDYKHRLPMGQADYVSFKKDVIIKAIRYGNGDLTDFINTSGLGSVENNSIEHNHTDLPSTPFAQPVKGRLQPGSLIYISGYIAANADVLSINLQSGDKAIPAANCALHLNPRFNFQVLHNTMVDELWGEEEWETEGFPFERGADLDIKIQCRSVGYKVWVDSKPFTEYDHRIQDLNRINCLSIEGNIEVKSISFTQEDPNQEDEEDREEQEEEAMDEDEEAAGDQSIEPESASISSTGEKESIDSVKQSSEKDEAMEQTLSEEPEASPQESTATGGDDASEQDSATYGGDNGSTQEGATTEGCDNGSLQEGVDNASGEEQTNSIEDGSEQKEAPSKDNENGADKEGKPKKKRRKLNDDKEDEEDESGAESDDSEKKDGDFDVERILTRRKGPDGDEYLLKWSGWSLYDCTWEPEANVSKGVRRAFNKPLVTKDRFVSSADIFYEAIQLQLTGSKGEQMRLRIEHDILRNILGDKGRPQDKADPSGWRIYNKSDLQAWGLPDNWWYRLDKKGHGKQVSFPMRMKVQLDWTSLSYVMDKHRKLIPAKRKPMELLLVQIKKREYSI